MLRRFAGAFRRSRGRADRGGGRGGLGRRGGEAVRSRKLGFLVSHRVLGLGAPARGRGGA